MGEIQLSTSRVHRYVSKSTCAICECCRFDFELNVVAARMKINPQKFYVLRTVIHFFRYQFDDVDNPRKAIRRAWR